MSKNSRVIFSPWFGEEEVKNYNTLYDFLAYNQLLDTYNKLQLLPRCYQAIDKVLEKFSNLFYSRIDENKNIVIFRQRSWSKDKTKLELLAVIENSVSEEIEMKLYVDKVNSDKEKLALKKLVQAIEIYLVKIREINQANIDFETRKVKKIDKFNRMLKTRLVDAGIVLLQAQESHIQADLYKNLMLDLERFNQKLLDLLELEGEDDFYSLTHPFYVNLLKTILEHRLILPKKNDLILKLYEVLPPKHPLRNTLDDLYEHEALPEIEGYEPESQDQNEFSYLEDDDLAHQAQEFADLWED